MHDSNVIKFALPGAVLASLLTSVMLSKGVTFTPDGWTYWEGSVSLLNNDGYVWFGGQAINVFPPLFPLILSLFELVLGISGFALFIYLVIFAGINSFLWIYLFSRTTNNAPPAISILFAVYIAFFSAAYYTTLLAETLSLPLLSLSLILLTKVFVKPRDISSIWNLLALGIILTSLLLTKNSNIAFFPFLFLVLMFFGESVYPARLIQAVILTAFPITIWLLVRGMLGQLGSHPIVLYGNYSFYEYTIQIINGAAYLLGPNIIGVFLLLASTLLIVNGTTRTIVEKQELNRNLRIFLIVVFGYAFFLFIIFNIIWIQDPLNGRFLWALPITILLALSFIFHGSLPRRSELVLLVVCALTVIQVARTSSLIWYRLQDGFQAHVQFNHTIKPHYVNGPPVECDNQILISPPDYNWIKRAQTHKPREHIKSLCQ